jgi:hypothetical protein
VPASPVATSATGDGVCRNDRLAAFVGQTKSDQLEAQLLAASGARLVRWVTPDMMITMDHREDRLTVRLGTDNRIGSLSCG